METKRLHRRWLWACIAALLLATLAGGFSFAVTAVFLIIYLTGAALFGRGDGQAPDESGEAEAEPPST